MRKLRRCLLSASAISLLSVSSVAPAQDWSRYLDGPMHRPSVAIDEYGLQKRLLALYKDSETEASIPDFTGDSDSFERANFFKRSGRYAFILYIFFENNHKTNRSLVEGNFKTGEIKWHKMDDLGGLFGPLVTTQDSSSLPKPVSESIAAYAKLLQHIEVTERP